MITYSKDELLRFLDDVDAQLTEPADLVLIGGAAAAIAYDVARATRDIDSWSALDGALSSALERARAQSPLAIPVEQAAVATRRGSLSLGSCSWIRRDGRSCGCTYPRNTTSCS